MIAVLAALSACLANTVRSRASMQIEILPLRHQRADSAAPHPPPGGRPECRGAGAAIRSFGSAAACEKSQGVILSLSAIRSRDRTLAYHNILARNGFRTGGGAPRIAGHTRG